MRCDQYQGLNKRARKIVEGVLKGVTEIGHTIYPDGTKVEFTRDRVTASKKVEVVGYIRGSYKGRAGLRRRYTLHDGRVLEEFLQEKIHCGGPNYFIALRDTATGEVVPESLWTEKEIKAFVG
jgi:hypothetical protein